MTSSVRRWACAAAARALVVGVLAQVALGVSGAPALASDASRVVESLAPIVVVREQVEPCDEGEPCRPTTVKTVPGQQGVVLCGPDGEQVQAPSATDIAGLGCEDTTPPGLEVLPRMGWLR